MAKDASIERAFVGPIYYSIYSAPILLNKCALFLSRGFTFKFTSMLELPQLVFGSTVVRTLPRVRRHYAIITTSHGGSGTSRNRDVAVSLKTDEISRAIAIRTAISFAQRERLIGGSGRRALIFQHPCAAKFHLHGVN